MNNNFAKLSYKQAIVISLLIHFVLIICLALLRVPNPVDPPPNFAAIEVAILPVTVAVAREAAPHVMPEDSPAATVPLEQAAPQPVSSTSQTDFTQVMSKTTNEDTAAVPQATFADAHGVAPTVAGSYGSSMTDGKQASNGVEGVNRQGGGARTIPKYLYGSKPTYPQAARKAGWEGVVVVRVFIDAGGIVESASIRDGSGYDILDEAAVQAVRKWRFSPAEKDGLAIASLHDVKVRFRLDETE